MKRLIKLHWPLLPTSSRMSPKIILIRRRMQSGREKYFMRSARRMRILMM
jgi:hypothetical protein